MIIDWAKYASKALITFVVTFAGQVIGGVSDGSITWQEWLVAGCWSIIAAGAVFGVSNGPDPRTQPVAAPGRHRLDGNGDSDPLPEDFGLS